MTHNTAEPENLTSDADVRTHDRAVVADYMSRKGETRKSRYLLFTEDGSAGLYTSDTGEPVVSMGHDTLQAHGEWSLRMFPDWEWTNELSPR